MAGMPNEGTPKQQPPTSAQEFLSKQETKTTNVLLDFYSTNKLNPRGIKPSKKSEAIKYNEFNYPNNMEQNQINSVSNNNSNNNNNNNNTFYNSREHLAPTKLPTLNNCSTNATDFCLKLMQENNKTGKEGVQMENEERGRGSRKRENGKSRYKTELCRPFEENGSCKYAEKCQFAHGGHELRTLIRHPKYKSDLCKTYHTTGLCPYGLRCHFIHNNHERYISNANKIILELAQKTFKQQSSLLNHQLIASFLNKQQFDNVSLEQLAKSLSLQAQQPDQRNIFKQALNSNKVFFSQHKHKQQAIIISRSMDSCSPYSSLNESPLSSPTNLSSHLPTNLPNNLPTNLSTHHFSNLACPHPPHILYREDRSLNGLLEEDLLSVKLKCIMQSAGF